MREKSECYLEFVELCVFSWGSSIKLSRHWARSGSLASSTFRYRLVCTSHTVTHTHAHTHTHTNTHTCDIHTYQWHTHKHTHTHDTNIPVTHTDTPLDLLFRCFFLQVVSVNKTIIPADLAVIKYQLTHSVTKTMNDLGLRWWRNSLALDIGALQVGLLMAETDWKQRIPHM